MATHTRLSIIAVLLASCGPVPDTTPWLSRSIELVDSVSMAALPSAHYTRFAHIGGRYYFLDPKSSVVAYLHPLSGEVGYMENPGSGPGEMASPNRIFAANDQVLIYDARPGSLHRYTPELNYVSRTMAEDRLFDIAYLGNSRFLSIRLDPDVFELLGFGPDGDRTAEIREPITHVSRGTWVLGTDSSSSRAVIGFLYGPEFRLRSETGEWTTHRHSDAPSENPMKVMGLFSLPKYVMQHAAFYLERKACLLVGLKEVEHDEPPIDLRILCFDDLGAPAFRIEGLPSHGPVLISGDTIHAINFHSNHIQRYALKPLDPH